MTLTIDQALQQAIEAHRAGRLAEAERLYRTILEAQPGHVDANHNLGVLVSGVGQPDRALPYLKAALEGHPGQGQFWISYVDALIAAGQPSDARAVLDQARGLGLSGDAVEQLQRRLDGAAEPSRQEQDELLASYRTQDLARAEDLARAMTTRFPGYDLGWKVLGAVFSVTGRFEASLAPMRAALALRPEDAETHKNLAIALLKLQRSAEAEAASRAALDLAPDYAQAHFNLGGALIGLERIAEAEASYREAIRLKPDYAEAFTNLGNTLKFSGRLSEAEAAYREAIRLTPEAADAHNNLGDVLKDLGRLADAEAFYRQALRFRPGYPEAYSNLLFLLNYIESLSPEASLEEARRYGAVISTQAQPKFTAWRAEPDPTRLRVGFVSGDLVNHPVGYFAEGMLKHLDPARFELLAFPTTPKTDALTDRIRPLFQAWLPLFGRNDREAAGIIHDQAPHVLIDLSGHTAHNRLSVFALKPAPVQVTWLGYFATTGLPEMDYFLGDPCMSPPDEAHHFTETVWNLPETWLCLTPPEPPVPVGPSPALANGFITFGCLGNLSKMNDEVVRLWATILRRVPTAKLFLKSKQLADAEVVDATRARFAVHGVDGDRLLLEGPSLRSDYFEAYGRVDIVLDTFPYPGGTTSVDALWMGVPVLTLKGDRFLSHLGESITRNARQPDWIAADQADYVEKAVRFASDPQALAARRATLRDQVLATPLFDQPRFAQAFGEALWSMWRRA